jgi:hemerythrin superfamily protein
MPNATQSLRQDHKKVEGLFQKCQQAKSQDAKRRFAMQAMNELEVHAELEEQIFYPAVKKAIEETQLVEEAVQEHKEAKALIAQLKNMRGQTNGVEDFDEKFTELVDAVQHHVEEEEGEMFPKVEDSELDLAELGSEMSARKRELMQRLGMAGAASRRRSKSKTKPKRKSTRAKSRSTKGHKRSSGKRARAR